jgi:hypothetical protein
MSFLIALGGLVIALLLCIVLDGIGGGRRERARRDLGSFDGW